MARRFQPISFRQGDYCSLQCGEESYEVVVMVLSHDHCWSHVRVIGTNMWVTVLTERLGPSRGYLVREQQRAEFLSELPAGLREKIGE